MRPCIPWLINRHYRDAGEDCRYILKAYSGSTSIAHESIRATGRYDFGRADLTCYNLGINDVAQGVPTAQSAENRARLLAWKKVRHPEASLVIFGPRSRACRAESSAGDIVGQANDPLVRFCDLSAAFDRSNDSNYLAGETAGVRVHPTHPALQQIWDGGYGSFVGLRNWLLQNVPALD